MVVLSGEAARLPLGNLLIIFSLDFWIQVHEFIASEFFQMHYLVIHSLLHFVVQLFNYFTYFFFSEPVVEVCLTLSH